MTLGYSTNAFVRFSLSDAIARIARLGFKGVEIMADRPHLYPPDYDAAALKRLKAQITQADLKITNINSFTLFAVGDTYLPSWIEADPQRRHIRIEHTRQCLAMAAVLECPNISIPPGGPLENMSRLEALQHFHRGLEQVVPDAERLGIRLLIEPEPDLLLERTSEFQEFIKDVASPAVGLNFDIGHFFCAGEAPQEAFETLFEYIGHVHIEDIAADGSHNHLIIGHGAIDFVSVFETMARLQYSGDISLELYPYTDRPEAAGWESLAALQPLMVAAGLLNP